MPPALILMRTDSPGSTQALGQTTSTWRERNALETDGEGQPGALISIAAPPRLVFTQKCRSLAAWPVRLTNVRGGWTTSNSVGPGVGCGVGGPVGVGAGNAQAGAGVGVGVGVGVAVGASAGWTCTVNVARLPVSNPSL